MVVERGTSGVDRGRAQRVERGLPAQRARLAEIVSAMFEIKVIRDAVGVGQRVQIRRGRRAVGHVLRIGVAASKIAEDRVERTSADGDVYDVIDRAAAQPRAKCRHDRVAACIGDTARVPQCGERHRFERQMTQIDALQFTPSVDALRCSDVEIASVARKRERRGIGGGRNQSQPVKFGGIARVQHGDRVEAGECDVEPLVIARQRFGTRTRAVRRVDEQTKIEPGDDVRVASQRDRRDTIDVGERDIGKRPAVPDRNVVRPRTADGLDTVRHGIETNVRRAGLRADRPTRIEIDDRK